MTTTNKQLSEYDLAYFREMFLQHAYSLIIEKFCELQESAGLTKKTLADAIGKDKSTITRLFNNPSNLTMSTFSDLMLAMEVRPRIVMEEISLELNNANNESVADCESEKFQVLVLQREPVVEPEPFDSRWIINVEPANAPILKAC